MVSGSTDFEAYATENELTEENSFKIYSNTNVSTFRTTSLKYAHGDFETRSYDFCYYELVVSPQINPEALASSQKPGTNLSLDFILREKENVSVYIYEGTSKKNATKA